VRAAFCGEEVDRVPVVPIICGFAGSIRSLGPREVLFNPTPLTNSLVDAQRLFGYDAVVAWFDPTTEAEACGCALDWSGGSAAVASPLPRQALAGLDAPALLEKGRIPVAREVAARLVRQVGRELALLGGVTGPLTLFRQLYGCGFGEALRDDEALAGRVMELAAELATHMVRLYGELGIDGVIIAEEAEEEDLRGILGEAGDHYRQLFGNIRYFELRSLLLCRHIGPTCLDELLEELLPDCVALSSGAGMREAVLGCRKMGILPAGAVSESAMLGGPREVEKEARCCREDCAGGPWLLATAWEVPAGAPLEGVRGMVEAGGS